MTLVKQEAETPFVAVAVMREVPREWAYIVIGFEDGREFAEMTSGFEEVQVISVTEAFSGVKVAS